MRSFRLFVLFLLVCMMCLGTPKASAAEETVHSHCVCGGSAEGVHEHACETIEWTPLSSVEGLDLSNLDWKNVPAGNYYLDGDVTVTAVTDGYSIGSAVKNADGTYTVESRQISLCLNGHTITTENDRVFKGVYTGSTLNICDCSGQQVDGIWQWDGSITGGTSSSGGIAYIYAQATANIYGGNLTAKEGQTVTSGGGLFYVAQDRAAVGNTVGMKPLCENDFLFFKGNVFHLYGEGNFLSVAENYRYWIFSRFNFLWHLYLKPKCVIVFFSLDFVFGFWS